MSTLEIAVALLRGTHMAALVSLFGTPVFLTLGRPPRWPKQPKMHRTCGGGCCVSRASARRSR